MTRDEYFTAKSFIANIVDGAQNRHLELPSFHSLTFGAIVGFVDLVDCVRQSPSLWFTGEYGFVLKNPRTLPTPVLCRGALGLWEVPDEVANQFH